MNITVDFDLKTISFSGMIKFDDLVTKLEKLKLLLGDEYKNFNITPKHITETQPLYPMYPTDPVFPITPTLPMEPMCPMYPITKWIITN
jgi:hypothetical protein